MFWLLNLCSTCATSFTTFYTPGEIDAQNGSATITLHANPLSPCVANAIDELELLLYDVGGQRNERYLLSL